MAGPSVKTIKRLCIVSGNLCAFPKCRITLVEQLSGKVTGRVCHIKGSQPGGPRYDASQTDEQRHGFDNLLLLCPIHHDVVDDDPDAYTVERLTKMKADHEAAHAGGQEPSDDVAKQFVVNVTGNTVQHGSILFNSNQMGGQFAHSITNVGPQPRTISEAAANQFVAVLRQQPPVSIELFAAMGDSEAAQLGELLKRVLEVAGWQVDGVNLGIFTQLPKGVVIEVPAATEALTLLLNLLTATGLKASGYIARNALKPRLIVGANL